jgi:hypothetical protein
VAGTSTCWLLQNVGVNQAPGGERLAHPSVTPTPNALFASVYVHSVLQLTAPLAESNEYRRRAVLCISAE